MWGQHPSYDIALGSPVYSIGRTCGKQCLFDTSVSSPSFCLSTCSRIQTALTLNLEIMLTRQQSISSTSVSMNCPSALVFCSWCLPALSTLEHEIGYLLCWWWLPVNILPGSWGQWGSCVSPNWLFLGWDATCIYSCPLSLSFLLKIFISSNNVDTYYVLWFFEQYFN